MADKTKAVRKMTRKITTASIQLAVKKGITQINDIDTKGFHVRIYESGVITYLLRYRSKLTNTRPVYKIGNYPTMDAETARAKAQKLVVNIREGIEPRIEDERKREAFERERKAKERRELQHLGYFYENVWKPHIERNKRGKEDIQRIDRHFKDWMDTYMPDITRRMVTRWQHDMENQGYAHLTIKRAYDVMKALLNYAADQDVIDKSPLYRVSLKKPPSSKLASIDEKSGEGPLESRRALTEKEVRQLFRGMELYTEDLKRMRAHSLTRKSKQHLKDISHCAYGYHAVPAVLTMYYGGFRPGDVLGLRWEHLYNDMKVMVKVIEKIAHHGKGKMRFPLGDNLSEVLKTWWAENGKPDSGYVFPSPRYPGEDRRLTDGALRKPWVAIKKFGGLDSRLHLYTLRHNFASQLIMGGTDLMTVKNLMGHSDIQTTISNYGHLLDDHVKEKLEALGTLQGKPNLKSSSPLKLVK